MVCNGKIREKLIASYNDKLSTQDKNRVFITKIRRTRVGNYLKVCVFCVLWGSFVHNLVNDFNIYLFDKMFRSLDQISS